MSDFQDENDPAVVATTDSENRRAMENAIARNLDGIPVPSLTTSYTLGERGPVLMQDDNCMQRLKHFVRGNPPPRWVLAKGIGAYGTFKVTNDISSLTRAKIFSEVGKKTEFFCRFSSSDCAGGLDGSTVLTAAFKFYTEDGNFDLMTIPVPVFLYSDPMLQLGYIRSVGKNPETNFHDSNMRWDFLLQVPQSVHHTLYTMADAGRPKTFRHACLSAINVFRLVNEAGKSVYCKWTLEPNQKYESLTQAELEEHQAKDPDFQIRDLFTHIEKGEGPSWTLYVQTMTEGQVANFKNKDIGTKWSAFDLTKFWPKEDYPMTKVGVLKVRRNVANHFNETEQSAFNAGRLVPGIQISVQDALLQGRTFAYQAAHAYRIGVNSAQLPVNYPHGVKGKLHTYSRDGFMNGETVSGGAPHYYPNSFGGPIVKEDEVKGYGEKIHGKIGRAKDSPKDLYSQPREFWESLSVEGKKRLVKNLVASASTAENFIKKGIISQFTHVSEELGKMLEKGFKTN